MDYHDVPADVLKLQITEEDLRCTPKPNIVNVVATGCLWNPFMDAETVTFRYPGFGYNPQRFAAVKMRQGRAMALVFCGGRVVCPGARSVMDARLAFLQFTNLLLDAGELVCFRRFRVQNIVCHCWAPFELELAAIQQGGRGRAGARGGASAPGPQFDI